MSAFLFYCFPYFRPKEFDLIPLSKEIKLVWPMSVRERSYIRNVSYLRNHDARVPELRNLVGFLN
jgi:hypothetical protein